MTIVQATITPLITKIIGILPKPSDSALWIIVSIAPREVRPFAKVSPATIKVTTVANCLPIPSKKDWMLENKYFLHEEPVCIVSSRPISDDEIPYFPWIKYGTDLLLDVERDAWWGERFSFPPNCIYVHNMETCLQMVLHGMGWAFLPEISLKKCRSLYTRPVIWKNGEHLVRKTSLIYKSSALERSASNAFIKYILGIHKNAVSANVSITRVD